MNRAFKTEWHGNRLDFKPIVTMSVRVNNGKLFKSLSKEDKKHLRESLQSFSKQVIAFSKDIK
jgi:hypothetical protein